MKYVTKFGTTDVTQHGGEIKTEIDCRKIDERKKLLLDSAINRVRGRSTSYTSFWDKEGRGNLTKTLLLDRLIRFLQEKL